LTTQIVDFFFFIHALIAASAATAAGFCIRFFTEVGNRVGRAKALTAVTALNASVRKDNNGFAFLLLVNPVRALVETGAAFYTVIIVNNRVPRF
jgi:hypothetical protein